MNIAVASDLRSEQLVKLVKTWPEVGSRNILSWWHKIIFSTQEDILNPLPFVAPYKTTFRAIDFFKKSAKLPRPKEEPRLLLSVREGIPNEYSRVWPLIERDEFVSERATVTSQRTPAKGKGLRNTLVLMTKKLHNKKF